MLIRLFAVETLSPCASVDPAAGGPNSPLASRAQAPVASLASVPVERVKLSLPRPKGQAAPMKVWLAAFGEGVQRGEDRGRVDASGHGGDRKRAGEAAAGVLGLDAQVAAGLGGIEGDRAVGGDRCAGGLGRGAVLDAPGDARGGVGRRAQRRGPARPGRNGVRRVEVEIDARRGCGRWRRLRLVFAIALDRCCRGVEAALLECVDEFVRQQLPALSGLRTEAAGAKVDRIALREGPRAGSPCEGRGMGVVMQADSGEVVPEALLEMVAQAGRQGLARPHGTDAAGKLGCPGNRQR